MKLKLNIPLISFILFTSSLFAQKVDGLIIDAENEKALSYVNVGVVNIPHGCSTDEKGVFSLNYTKLPKDARIRVSMIGYQSQEFSLEKFKEAGKKIRLVRSKYELDEVKIKWKEIIRKVGTLKTNKRAGVCGWGGTKFAKGHGIGLLLHLGDDPVKIENLNIKLRKHSFDSVTLRLHIRSMNNGLPNEELLHENIYLTLKEARSWQKLDVSDYNIRLSGDVALTLEWVKVGKVIERRKVKMNGSKIATPIVLFECTDKEGPIFTRWGSADKWKRNDKSSPGIYVTIKE